MNPTRPAWLTFTTTILAVVALGFAAFPGGGCATQPAKDAFQPATPSSLAALRDSEFRLTRFVVDGAPVDSSAFPISLRFGEPGKISGRSAVNRYFGGFELGDNGSLTWPPAGLGMTRMAGPEAAMKLESQFAEVLTGTSQLLTSPTGARFQSVDGSRIAEFRQ